MCVLLFCKHFKNSNSDEPWADGICPDRKLVRNILPIFIFCSVGEQMIHESDERSEKWPELFMSGEGPSQLLSCKFMMVSTSGGKMRRWWNLHYYSAWFVLRPFVLHNFLLVNKWRIEPEAHKLSVIVLSDDSWPAKKSCANLQPSCYFSSEMTTQFYLVGLMNRWVLYTDGPLLVLDSFLAGHFTIGLLRSSSSRPHLAWKISVFTAFVKVLRLFPPPQLVCTYTSLTSLLALLYLQIIF